MSDFEDRATITLISMMAEKLKKSPPNFAPDKFQLLMESYLSIGDTLITLQGQEERKDNVTNG